MRQTDAGINRRKTLGEGVRAITKTGDEEKEQITREADNQNQNQNQKQFIQPTY